MATVVRFALPTARNLNVPGLGAFVDGILDVDANNWELVQRARYRVTPYGATEIGFVDSSTPKPPLPAVPAAPMPDPFPQYLTPAEIATSPEVRASAVAAVQDAITDGVIEVGSDEALVTHEAATDPHAAAGYAVMVDGGRHIFTRTTDPASDPTSGLVDGDIWWSPTP